MASISRSRRLPEPRSGGKIVRPRRAASAKTPYDRPAPSNSTSRSPSWLSRFVFSPTRSIASGAGKLLSTVFDLESSPTSSSSSSSSSSSANDSTAEEEIGNANDDNGISFKGDDTLNKKWGTLEVINASGKDLQPVVQDNKNKHVIEQLIMCETFSREECDRFIRIIRSRVVDTSANEERNQRPSDMLIRTLANDSPDLSSAAVMEAKKWLKEQKSRLDSNSDLGYGSHNLNMATLPQALKDEGSPVDVAKSYMRSRPPWSSPSVDHSKPLTPIGIQLLKEDTPYPVSGYSASSTKLKRDSPATGSWSIQDEIRRVRSRATEQMLSSLPSSKIDWSAFAVECKNNVNPSATENIESAVGEKVPNFTNSVSSLNLVNEFNTHEASDLERKQGDVQLESARSDSANINSEQNQGSQTNVWQTEGSHDDCRERTISEHKLSVGGMVKVNGVSDMNGANYEIDSTKETREASESVLHDGSCSVLKEKVGADVSANGFPSSGPSNAGPGTEQNDKTLDNKHDTVGLGDERISKGAAEQETCEPRSGTCTEVPDVTVNNNIATNEDDGVATGSQNSSSVQNEFEQEHSEVAPEPDLAVSTRSIADKQKGKRISKYNRRGRSRGRAAK
ncbi:protein KAKU4 isoform X2 [Prosopis cineraria]|uniref:protein KAKU4 isoform X2 n=1 Tax=Prosopis cineraria TaxID=364024 RepID=UPI00240EBEDC|nr:protein KAKU4 isoform X2 [Prosopis cineraria]